MVATDEPAETLVQTCELVMKAEPGLSEWRACVDEALAVHASEGTVKRCKLSAIGMRRRRGRRRGGLFRHVCGVGRGGEGR